MSTNVRMLRCEPEHVFDVLSEGWLYPSWVVGASRMRDVDTTWPQPGAELHHSVGAWPLLIDDSTVSLEWDPPRHAALQARGWPLGEARVTIDVKPHSPGRCIVRMQEEAVSGPGRFVPAFLLDMPLYWRNRESLHRLAYLAEGRAITAEPSTAEREGADD